MHNAKLSTMAIFQPQRQGAQSEQVHGFLASRFYWKNLDFCVLVAERRLEVAAITSSPCAKLKAGSSE